MFATQGKVLYDEVSYVTRVYLGVRVKPDIATEITKSLNPLGIKVIPMKVKRYAIVFEA
jgi:hypothetical protein